MLELKPGQRSFQDSTFSSHHYTTATPSGEPKLRNVCVNFFFWPYTSPHGAKWQDGSRMRLVELVA